MKVFESGSGKWVFIRDSEVRYTSNIDDATVFDDITLQSAHQYFGDFAIYKKTLFVYPKGSNMHPWEGRTVTEYINDLKQKEEDY